MKECGREGAASGSTDANAVRGILSDGLGAEPASNDVFGYVHSSHRYRPPSLVVERIR